jgi:hypothetical protein
MNVVLKAHDIPYTMSCLLISSEVVSLQKLLSNLGQLVDVIIIICCDYISSILLANNSIYRATTKHTKAYYHFVRKKFPTREINLIHVNIKDQVADIFTKALSIDKLRNFLKCLMY